MLINKNKNLESLKEPNKFEIIILDSDIGLYELHYNVNIIIIEDPIKNISIFRYDNYTTMVMNKDLDEIKGCLIKLRYSDNKENSLINKGIANIHDPKYIEYVNHVLECKLYVDLILNKEVKNE